MRYLILIFMASLVLFLPQTGRADVIKLKSGTKVVGRIRDPKADPLVVETLFGERTFLKKEVAHVTICPTPWEEYDKRLKKAGRKDLDKLVELMDWARDPERRSFLGSRLRRLYRWVLRLDKDNEIARQELGYRRIGGEWVSRAEAKRREKEKAAASSAATDKRRAEAERLARLKRAESDVGLQMKMNRDADAREEKLLSNALTAEMNVGTSKRISIAGTFGTTQIRTLLDLGERALTEVCTDLGLDPKYNPGRAGHRGVHHHYFVKPIDRNPMIAYVRDNYGGISKAFFVYLMKSKGSGLSANAGSPHAISVERNQDRKDVFLHNLGHVIADSLGGGGNCAPWLKEGYGMYMSIRYLKRTATHCTTFTKYAESKEVAKKDSESSWALLVREQVAKGNYTRFIPLSIRKLNMLTEQDLARSWIICKVLMDTKPKEFKSFMRYTGETRRAQDRALKVSLEMVPPQLDAYVDKWVKTNLK